MHDLTKGDVQLGGSNVQAITDIKTELRMFEEEERLRLGIDSKCDHWRNTDPVSFTKAQRAHTTILFGGLTVLHDTIIGAGLSSLGYRAEAMECPDNAALQAGKEFGNRGQCNPTYFTVGNLLKYLVRLRDEEGMDSKDIVNKYAFATVGGCGPCRFGTYVTEYRKVLRDAGFDGFRIFDIRNFGQHKEKPELAGLELNLKFYLMFFKCIMAGDVINAMGYRIRPYEVTAGATDEAVRECTDILYMAFKEGRSILRALRRCRKVLAKVKVDRSQVKPKVSIIGEFWAMTTEGEGNYNLQRFLESEGAECEIQLITSWGLYEIWEAQHDTRERMMLRWREGEKHDKETDSPIKILFSLWLAYFLIEKIFMRFARAAGLKNYHLPNMGYLARISHDLYPNELRGGEGHMEVGKVIEASIKKKAHMVVSVKPFGCMPSSGVSDGVQSLVGAKYPDLIFCPIETSGDGAVSVYSRVQMAMFKARTRAREEYEKAISDGGFAEKEEKYRESLFRKFENPLNYPRHFVVGTAANAVYAGMGGWKGR